MVTPRGPYASPFTPPVNPLSDPNSSKPITSYDQRIFNNPYRSIYNTTFYGGLTRDKVRNMTVLQKMWRNIDGGNNLEIAYLGETAYPSYIAPYSRPLDVIKPFNRITVYEDSMHMTIPSQYRLLPKLWQTWEPMLGERVI